MYIVSRSTILQSYLFWFISIQPIIVIGTIVMYPLEFKYTVLQLSVGGGYSGALDLGGPRKVSVNKNISLDIFEINDKKS